MDGQWFGRLSNDQTEGGFAILDLDDCGDHYSGSGFIFEDDPELPGTYARVVTPNKDSEQNLVVPLMPVDRVGGGPMSLEEMAQRFPNALHASQANFHFKRQGNELHVTFTTDEPVRSRGSGVLFHAPGENSSVIQPDTQIDSWPAFKDELTGVKPRRYIFRGQSDIWRLRTTFHRTRRSDLVRFINEDRIEMHRALTPIAKHYYDLSDADQVGAFYSLMQHHGYPTPFLDWSWSPFIAAFFAFRPKPAEDATKVRVFMFDLESWEQFVPRKNAMTYIPPHVSFVEFLNVENSRAGPQQAVSIATNIDDVEAYIRIVERDAGKIFLRAFDLPVTDRQSVMNELSLMGITAASVFPGLDGVAESVKNRMFGY